MKAYILEILSHHDGYYGAVYDYYFLGFKKPTKNEILEFLKSKKYYKNLVDLKEVDYVPEIYLVSYNEKRERKVLGKFDRVYKDKN